MWKLYSKLAIVIIFDKITDTFYFLSLTYICQIFGTVHLLVYFKIYTFVNFPYILTEQYSEWKIEILLIPPFHIRPPLPQVMMVESLMCMVLGLFLYIANIHTGK